MSEICFHYIANYRKVFKTFVTSLFKVHLQIATVNKPFIVIVIIVIVIAVSIYSVENNVVRDKYNV